MLPAPITQTPHMPSYPISSEDTARYGLLIKRTLQLLKLSISSGCSQYSTVEPIETDVITMALYNLSVEEKKIYKDNIFLFYIVFFLESYTNEKKLEIALSNDLVIHVENIGNDIVLRMEGQEDIVENANFETIPHMLECFIFKYNRFFYETDIYSVVKKHYSERKHLEFDILTNANPGITPPCFLMAEYLKSGSSDPQTFSSPELDHLSKTGHPMDIGCFFCSVISHEVFLSDRDDIKVEEYPSTSKKISSKIRAQEHLLCAYADEIVIYIRNSYPIGCILKSGDREGSYFYYDAQKDILLCGGMADYDNGISGMGLKDFFFKNFNRVYGGRKATITLTDHNASELRQESERVSETLGMTYEKNLKAIAGKKPWISYKQVGM